MWFSRAAKRRPGVCLVGLSPNFKKPATSELQVCTTRRVGDLLRAERRWVNPSFFYCTWTSRGFALKRYSSADVLTRPVPHRLIFRAIADGVFMADVLPAFDRERRLSSHTPWATTADLPGGYPPGTTSTVHTLRAAGSSNCRRGHRRGVSAPATHRGPPQASSLLLASTSASNKMAGEPANEAGEGHCLPPRRKCA
ncbi:uncharacterized protein LOC119399855 isoform X2 [Rhipicephalus sanguineus]|uniref:uncharacterized protein LOC119399855 isoform X2 n=1 Tax=Rhipicephalus sanguineus TaxID=34632 RepID=UPI0020C43005|nr:uncharacterized protein LOC119399855 isoform X2 [Rhipicephalus sanguineus]